MAQLSQKKNDQQIFSYTVAEFTQYDRSVFWYVIAIIVFGTILFVSMRFIDMYLAIVIMLGAIVFYQLAFATPEKVTITFGISGLEFKKRMYSYGHFKSFAIVSHHTKRYLHLEQLNFLRSPIIIPIPDNKTELSVRVLLQKVLPEQVRTRPTFGDRLMHIFRF